MECRDPHHGTKDVYVTHERDVIAPGGKQRSPYADGTIVVKESRADAGFIRIVAIMRENEGSNPAGIATRTQPIGIMCSRCLNRSKPWTSDFDV